MLLLHFHFKGFCYLCKKVGKTHLSRIFFVKYNAFDFGIWLLLVNKPWLCLMVDTTGTWPISKRRNKNAFKWEFFLKKKTANFPWAAKYSLKMLYPGYLLLPFNISTGVVSKIKGQFTPLKDFLLRYYINFTLHAQF